MTTPMPAPCPNVEMGCDNQAQCWEPCGALGHSAEHARVSTRSTRDAFEAAYRSGNMGALAYADFKAGWQAATEQGKRQPLTDDRITEIYKLSFPAYDIRSAPQESIQFARAIEAAVITATPQGKI